MVVVGTTRSAVWRRRPLLDRPNETHGTQQDAFDRNLAEQDRCRG
jgi:hypothetical protein